MPLDVNTQPDLFLASLFRFTVPGTQRWTLRAVRADVDRGAGGAPDRSYVLRVTNGTSTVLQIGADDAGDEPGTASICWANAAASKTAAGPDGVVVAPLAAVVVEAGYEIIGEIVGNAFTDAWVRAVVWYDFEYTNV